MREDSAGATVVREDRVTTADARAPAPPVVRDLSREEVRPEIAPLDLLILGGGGLLYDGSALIYLREVAIAQELGVPVVVYAVSAGPLEYISVREAVRGALDRAAAVTVRDRGSQRLLEDVGVRREVRVTADPALLMRV